MKNIIVLRAFALVLLLSLAACGGGGGGGGGTPPPATNNPPPVVNPLDTLLPSNALTVTGIFEDKLNPTNVTIRYNITGSTFALKAEDVTVTINDAPIPSAGITITATEITVQTALADGKNVISFSAYDEIGRPLYLTRTVWSGGVPLQVNLVDEAGAPVTELADVRLSISSDSSVGADINTTTGVATFSNVPAYSVVLVANTASKLYGTASATGLDGSVTVTMIGFKPASLVDNNDFTLGLSGWDTDSTTISIIPHEETVGPAPGAAPLKTAVPKETRGFITVPPLPSAQVVEGAQPLAVIENSDLMLSTYGIGAKKVTRTFKTKPGASAVLIRYRFVTQEVPAGFFGSEFDDTFVITVRSKSKGTTNEYKSSMNALGLGAFDFLTGSTGWKTITVDYDPTGDEIQFAASVANVGDGDFDSAVIIDYAVENTNYILPKLEWNNVAGGLKLTYLVENGPVPADTVVGVFWASDKTATSKIGTPIFTFTVPAGTTNGLKGPVAVPGNLLSDNPAGMTHIVAVATDTAYSPLPDVKIFYGQHAKPSVVTAAMLDIVMDGHRVAGAMRGDIARTAVDSEGQARAMFQNLTNAEHTVEDNIINQVVLYGDNGIMVIEVFEKLAAGKTRDEILANATAIKAAMKAEIDRLGAPNVSNHCADPKTITVVDVQTSNFAASTGSIFLSTVTPRLSSLPRDETELGNNCYHLELKIPAVL